MNSDSSNETIAVRALGLSPESLAALSDMLERVRQLEDLNEQEEATRPRDTPDQEE